MGSTKAAIGATAATATPAKAKKEKAETKKQKIALGSDESEGEEQEEAAELKVNAKFAKEYMDRKRKEELTKLERQRAYLENDDDDDDESDSETEDEDGEELTAELDNDIKKTLRLIRKRDPIIYDKSVTFFKAPEPSSDSEDGETKAAAKSAKKADAPLYYKDLVRQQVIAEDMDSEEEEDDSDQPPSRVMTYGEEQAQLKAEFMKTLNSATASEDEEEKEAGGDEDDSDLEGGLFSIRTKSAVEAQQDDAEYEAFQSKYGTKLKQKDTLDPEAFLDQYLNGGWKEKKTEIPHYEDIVQDDEEDAEELDKMEAFEHAYNFRFEEQGSGVIQTYARQIEDTLRRGDDSRKRKREERKARKAAERLKKEEELKRLKNLKQAELQSKLAKISQLVGKGGGDKLETVLAADLEGDFDPDEYDRRMQQVFDDEYYNEDEDEAMMEEKPTWDDEEDKALFADLPGEEEEEETVEEEEEQTVVEEEEQTVEEEEEETVDEVEEDVEEEEGDDAEEGEKDMAAMTPAELARAKQKYLDELYSLDYEDLIGDLKCRFKYRSVARNDFGLTAEEIMAADDKELKQLVSLKRLAPYVEQEYTVHRKSVKQFRQSLEEKLAQEAAQTRKGKKAAGKAEQVEEKEEEGTKVEEAAPSTKKRKRSKKSKAVAVEETEAEKPQTADAATVATTEKETEEKTPKKQRRSGKKGKGKAKGESNPYAATGLSSSRLESYKLLKSTKK